MKKNYIKGFTLIELLMVIAIIGLLAGILFPTIGSVRKDAGIAAGKAQLTQYLNAIGKFKLEYGYYPFSKGKKDYVIDLSNENVSRMFIELLSGRDAETGDSKGVGGNKKRITLHSFSEKEFYIGDDDLTLRTQLADRFNNTNIKIMIDGNDDGFIFPDPTLSNPQKPEQKLREQCTAWVESEEIGSQPAYSLWED